MPAEIGEAKIRIEATEMTRERAERISRLVFYHLHLALASNPLGFGVARALPHLAVPALEVNPAEQNDDEIARRGAAWVYRWLRASE